MDAFLPRGRGSYKLSGALRHSHAQMAVAVSGIAGPGGSTLDKPVGMVWFAWGIQDGVCTAQLHQLPGDHMEIQTQAVHIALQGALEMLHGVSQLA